MRQWGATWGLPYIVKSERGPVFRAACEKRMAKFGVKLIHSSSYNPQSDGLVERGVRSLKHLLKGSGLLNQLQLQELVYCVNAQEQAQIL